MISISQNCQQAADRLKTIAHPTRLRIIQAMIQQASVNVSALKDQLNMDQLALSHHLIKLKEKGILSSVQKGNKMYYALADQGVVETITLLLNR